MPQLTAQQQAAVAASGNVLLMAGAGTGKTSTLVARCLYWLFDAPTRTSLDRILMVTFTEAAATEMRERLRRALWERSQKESEREAVQHQLALLDSAHIRTLHSFNLELIRSHFLELNIDPQPAVLDPPQARLLQEEVLDELWDAWLAPKEETRMTQVRQWLKSLGPDAERLARQWILELHRHWRTRPNAEGWLNDQLGLLAKSSPEDWMQKLPRAFTAWAAAWKEYLDLLDQPHYADNAKILPETIHHAKSFAQLIPNGFSTLAEVSACLRAIQKHDTTSNWPKRQAEAGRAPIKKFLQETDLLLAYLPDSDVGGANPLAEDWGIVRPWLTTLLELLREFDQCYTTAKRQQGALDFNDFEQLALRLLYDHGQPSAIAQQWRQRFEFVLVDEYQDINPAQDAILRALSREGREANRFLVGDVKQSIYRFREADPKIFQNYASQWAQAPHCQVLYLNENFRSREAILHFVNQFFAGLMIEKVGGVQYDQRVYLQFGAPDHRQPLSRQSEPEDSRRVELNLIMWGQAAAETEPEEKMEEADEATVESPGGTAAVEADKLKIEARLVAQKLQQLKGQYAVWRPEANKFSPADWRDMVVLLRGPRGRIPAFLHEFNQAGIPLRAEADNFLESQEVKDLLNLLRLLDNPRQDLPLVAVLRSPFVGLKLDDLAAIRLASRKGCLWLALQRWVEQGPAEATANSPQGRVKCFLERYRRWRDLACRGSLITCLETILNETFYDVWCRNQPEGAQRHANVQHFLHLARHFDTLQRQGLHRFLQYVEAYAKLELQVESPQTVPDNCVRLMSIHQSKGLEFPIVVLACLGTRFNLAQEEVLWDDELGLCPRVRGAGLPPYPTLVRKLAQKNNRPELIGEELRLLYVAMTRARDLLILTGSTTQAQWNRWQNRAFLPISAQTIASAQGPLEWLARWWFNHTPTDHLDGASGVNEFLRWRIYPPQSLAQEPASSPAPPSPAASPAQDEDAAAAPLELVQLWTSLANWKYPALAATLEPAKTHVSALRHRAALEHEDVPEGQVLRQTQPPTRHQAAWADQARGMKAGAVHHLFLERLDLSLPPDREHLQQQAAQMMREGLLNEEEIKQLNWSSLIHFWNSDIGRAIRDQAARVHREIPFTARFTAEDLRRTGISLNDKLDNTEFMVVQGIADLVVVLDDELWVLDYKTDHITAEEIADRSAFYALQIQLYGLALGRIFKRRVRHLWLHFLHPGITASIPPIGAETAWNKTS
ncbi:MAG: UvrD-helicase domain-containing protein [Verrucomicrobiae bacterium]|nr:UvrD-helicase domain-containing protein [Verrucomicrobiae bacterium]